VKLNQEVSAAIVRYAGTGFITGLSAAYLAYPGQTWMLIAIPVLSALGFHVVPTGSQYLPKGQVL